MKQNQNEENYNKIEEEGEERLTDTEWEGKARRKQDENPTKERKERLKSQGCAAFCVIGNCEVSCIYIVNVWG